MKKSHLFRKHGFTLSELMIVIIIMGIIAGFAIPQYQKTLQGAYERSARRDLLMVHAAEQSYRAENGEYWPIVDSSPFPVDSINSNLKLNLIEEGVTYSCISNGGGTDNFNCTATQSEAGWTLRVDESPLGANNPCCSAGTCPTIPGC